MANALRAKAVNALFNSGFILAKYCLIIFFYLNMSKIFKIYFKVFLNLIRVVFVSFFLNNLAHYYWKREISLLLYSDLSPSYI